MLFHLPQSTLFLFSAPPAYWTLARPGSALSAGAAGASSSAQQLAESAADERGKGKRSQSLVRHVVVPMVQQGQPGRGRSAQAMTSAPPPLPGTVLAEHNAAEPQASAARQLRLCVEELEKG